jgi:hypothetical protein
MYLNGVIFQAHCVYFEIKKEQIATPFISDYTTQQVFSRELKSTIFN